MVRVAKAEESLQDDDVVSKLEECNWFQKEKTRLQQDLLTMEKDMVVSTLARKFYYDHINPTTSICMISYSIYLYDILYPTTEYAHETGGFKRSEEVLVRAVKGCDETQVAPHTVWRLPTSPLSVPL